MRILEKLNAIQPIIRRFHTYGSSPVLVMGDDYNLWVCKYNDYNKLFNELLAAEFAKLWDIKVPKNALITIDYERCVKEFEDKRGLERRFFERECFSSQFIRNAIDVNHSILNNTKLVEKIVNKDDLLKIALFDIWLSNEDRNIGNYNLLLQAINDSSLCLYVIDHSDIFNSSMAYSYALTEITEEESLLSTDLALLLFQKDNFLQEKVVFLVRDFYNYVRLCDKNLSTILAKVPKNWKIDIPYYESKIRRLFSLQWLRTCEYTFREYTNRLIHF